MIKSIISDFSKVLLFSKDPSLAKFNAYHEEKLIHGDYNFWEYFTLNDDLLNFYKDISSKIEVYVFTTRYIQEYPPVKEKIDPVFKGVFIADKLGVKKDKPEAYQLLADELKLMPEEILFIDDTKANIDSAQSVGINTVRFIDTESAISQIQRIVRLKI